MSQPKEQQLNFFWLEDGVVADTSKEEFDAKIEEEKEAQQRWREVILDDEEYEEN